METTTETPAAPIPYAFATAGHYHVRGVYVSASVVAQPGSLTVHVVEHAFVDSPACWQNWQRTWNVTGPATGSVLQADTRLQSSAVITSNGTQVLTLKIDSNVPRFIVSRVTTNGPILAAVAARGLALGYAHLVLAEVDPDGSQVYEMGFVQSPVQPDVELQIRIIVGGITFDDGTTVRRLTADDFDPNGSTKVRFLRPANSQTSVCHVLGVYQATTLIGGSH